MELPQVQQSRFLFLLPDKLNLFPIVGESHSNSRLKKQRTQVKFILNVLNFDLLVVRVRSFVDAEAQTIGHGPLSSSSQSNTVDC